MDKSVRKNVYVVDDDESVCRALKLLLQSYDFHVETFSNADDFFKNVMESSQGCLILDIHMPGTDGWSTLQQLYARGSTRRVIIMSAEKNGNLKDKVLKAGAVGFFQKPVNDQDLVELINQAASQ